MTDHLWPPRGYSPIKQPHCDRDPFSIGAAIVTLFSTSTGIILAADAFLIASGIVGAVTVGALIGGANYALQKTLTDKQAFSPSAGGLGVASVNAPDVRSSVRQSAPAQRIVYGRTRVGGAVFFLDTDSPPWLYLGLLLSSRKISAVRGLQIAGNNITFLTTSVANNTILTPFPTPGQVYVLGGVSRLFCCFRDGSPTQTIDALIDADFTALSGEFRQRSIATATFKFKYGNDRTDFENMWGQVGIPAPAVEVDGAPVYDPRDATQNVNDETTWKFSRNAALIQADWMRQPYGVNFPVDRIDYDKVAASANFDDEVIVNADGSAMKRHTIDGVVQLNQKPREVMEAMLTANRGFLVQSSGRGWVQSSQPRSPILTITDGLMVGGFEFRDDKAKRDTFNKVTSRFPSTDREHQDIDGPILERNDLITEDEEVLEGTVRIPFTSDHRAVQRLQKQYLEESRLPRALSCRVKLTAMTETTIPQVGECVLVDSVLFPRMNCEYTIEEIGYTEDFSSISLALTEYDDMIPIDWNAPTDEQSFTLPFVNLS
jgi:hypothetical protein